MGAAFIASAGTIIGAAQTLIGGNSKDAERLAKNAAALSAANAGNDNALAYLKQATGEYGIAYVPGYGNTGGWATEVARADAKVKYQAALAVRAGQNLAGDVGDVVQDVVQKTGNTIVPGTKEDLAKYAVLAVVAILALVLFLRRKSG